MTRKADLNHRPVRASSNRAGGTSPLLRKIVKQRYLILMVLPGFLLIFIFKYIPMYGVLISFENYNFTKGVLGSHWVGFKYYIEFFQNPQAWPLFRNTLLLGVYSLLWSFPAPIILALLMNEIRSTFFKKAVQTVTYLPYFLSAVVIVGMVSRFASTDGIFNSIRALFGLARVPMLAQPQYFRTLFIGSGIWQTVGYNCIIYLAALSGVDTTLYDVASLDGANRWQKMLHITWPAIKPTTTILLLLNLGSILNTDYQKVLLMYNPSIYDVSDVLGTYIYRLGVLGGQFEYTTAVGLLLSVISFALVFFANQACKKLTDNSLW